LLNARHRQANRTARPADFLYRDYVVEIAEAEPAPFLFYRDPVQAQRAHRFPQLARETIIGSIFSGKRRICSSAKRPAASRIIMSAFGQGRNRNRGRRAHVLPTRAGLEKLKNCGTQDKKNL
jgi:hypothetical protein